MSPPFSSACLSAAALSFRAATAKDDDGNCPAAVVVVPPRAAPPPLKGDLGGSGVAAMAGKGTWAGEWSWLGCRGERVSVVAVVFVLG